MKKQTIVILGVFLVSVFGLSSTQLLTMEKDKTATEHKSSVSSFNLPPSSLDAFYPPKSKEPIYLIRMFGLNEKMMGIVIDLMEEDIANVGPNFEKFKDDYVGISKLVPEWEDKYPLGPVEELGKALQSGDKGIIMSACEKVGHSCHVCHIETMAGVKAKYHWQEFRQIKVNDPISKTEVNFVQMMKNLNFSFSGATYDLKQGQQEKAEENARAFQIRFQSVSETCQECHGTSERAYYVDDSIRQAIADLVQALSKTPPDQKEITNNAMTIGMEGCFKCHLVHVPPTYTKYQWEE